MMTQPNNEKCWEFLTRRMYSYVFYVAKSKSEFKIAPFTISFRHNQKNLIFEYVMEKHGFIKDFKSLN